MKTGDRVRTPEGVGEIERVTVCGAQVLVMFDGGAWWEWFDARKVRRIRRFPRVGAGLLWLLRWTLAFLWLPAFGQVPQTVVSDTLVDAFSGQPVYQGTLHISWPQFAYNTTTVPAGDVTLAIANGVMLVSLTPTDRARSPVSYSVRITVNGISTLTYWNIPTGGGPYLVSQVTASYSPGPNTSVSLSQLLPGGATSGQCLEWSGSMWAPASCLLNVPWGGISGSLANQADLVAALGGKQATITGAPPAWPGFAAVATSGSYADLSNKPAIPAAQVNSDWNASGGPAQILNKPTLGTAAAHAATDFQPAGAGLSGLTPNQFLYATSPTAAAGSANLLYGQTVPSLGYAFDSPALVDSKGCMAGLIAYGGFPSQSDLIFDCTHATSQIQSLTLVAAGGATASIQAGNGGSGWVLGGFSDKASSPGFTANAANWAYSGSSSTTGNLNFGYGIGQVIPSTVAYYITVTAGSGSVTLTVAWSDGTVRTFTSASATNGNYVSGTVVTDATANFTFYPTYPSAILLTATVTGTATYSVYVNWSM
jgi:hypothetical protein